MAFDVGRRRISQTGEAPGIKNIGTTTWIITALDAREHSHGVGGGGFDTIVGAATSGEEVVAGPGHMVPGDDAEQQAGGEIITILGVVLRRTESAAPPLRADLFQYTLLFYFLSVTM
jgi:hypothetical protein